ncbi:DUF4194 domain-containing protein [Nocardiopsis metallicus]|uniref:DUF4194 domain-containing protein n=1 Tax=Nocardiopsis metallicus TaxID=179819 RepID=A0A840WE28_9ACTN|nr:DUF4194 domain-containing protein [Nocardiopsis metallicus]MBB5493673.1 hypothetical protein [Nocardiopsis metallicus]
MSHPPEPSFEEVFGETERPGAAPSSPAGIASDNLSEVFDDEGDTVGSHVEGATHQPRFDGDTGALPAETSWALQALVAAPHVSQQHPKHWATVLQYEDILRSRLSELGLILEINREHGYAFTRQAEDPSPHSRTILRTKTLNLAASTLCLYLYNQYVLSPDAPVVETADMEEHMRAYRRPTDTDDAAFQRRIATAIKSLEDAAIIKPVKGTSRYVVYGVIASILTAERVEALSSRFKALVDSDRANTPGTPPSTSLHAHTAEGPSQEDTDA